MISHATKATVCPPHHLPEAAALLLGALNQGHQRIPLEGVLHSPNMTRRVAEWGIKLQAFTLDFVMTKTIKRRALAEFVVEWTPSVPALLGKGL